MRGLQNKTWHRMINSMGSIVMFTPPLSSEMWLVNFDVWLDF
jgi:hypothetical protein